MNEDVLPFFDAYPRNDLIDYLLIFDKLEKLILGKLHPSGLPVGVKGEYKKNRKTALRKLGKQAQEIIDWWAKKQAREHKKAIEHGRTISIIKGKEHGKRISKNKYEEIIIREDRHVRLPDTPENRAMTTAEGYKVKAGETMVLVSVLDTARFCNSTAKKIESLSGGVAAKFLFLGKAMMMLEGVVHECQQLLRSSKKIDICLDSFEERLRSVGEFCNYSKFSFIHKDKSIGKRENDLIFRDAKLRYSMANFFAEDDVGRGLFVAEELLAQAWLYFSINQLGLSEAAPVFEKDALYNKFCDLLDLEIKCRVVNGYFSACGGVYQNELGRGALVGISVPCSISTARSYVTSHLTARKNVKVKLGLVRASL